jgi:hypothetical protein
LAWVALGVLAGVTHRRRIVRWPALAMVSVGGALVSAVLVVLLLGRRRSLPARNPGAIR